MYQWSISTHQLKFKNLWTIHGGSALLKTNHYLKVSLNNEFGIGEISLSTKIKNTNCINDALKKIDLQQLQSIEDILKLNAMASIKHALELAFINLQLKLNKKKLNEYFEIPENKTALTNISIPIIKINEVKNYIIKNKVNNFESLKVKINGQNSIEFLNEIQKYYKGPLRIDANECFDSAKQCLNFINSCHSLNVDFLEQPLKQNSYSESKIIKKESPWLIIGDESLQNENVTTKHIQSFDGLNIKLLKAGGPTQALKQILQCKKYGLKILIGCMVESSLNISTALQLGYCADWFDLDGCLLLKNDPFNLIQLNHGEISLKN